jgi:hypothetical protein
MTEPGHGLRRPITMRRTLGTLFATAALVATAGCGSSTSSTTTTSPNSPSPGPVTGAHVYPLISMTGGGGRVSQLATELDTPAQVTAFAAQFRAPALHHRIVATVAKAEPRGLAVYGAVVAVGCDRPPGVKVVLDGSGRVQIVPEEVASPLPECLAAVTTVAIVSVPGSD